MPRLSWTPAFLDTSVKISKLDIDLYCNIMFSLHGFMFQRKANDSPVIENRTVLTDIYKEQDWVGRNPYFIHSVGNGYRHKLSTAGWWHSFAVLSHSCFLFEWLDT